MSTTTAVTEPDGHGRIDVEQRTVGERELGDDSLGREEILSAPRRGEGEQRYPGIDGRTERCELVLDQAGSGDEHDGPERDVTGRFDPE